MSKYKDLTERIENDRILQIAMAISSGLKVAVIVDDLGSKAQRYTDKIRALCPGVEVLFKHSGPTPGVCSMGFQCPLNGIWRCNKCPAQFDTVASLRMHYDISKCQDK